MGLMGTLINTRKLAPPKVILYGQPGVGKTTFAASAKAILLDCENGAGAVPGLKRTPYLKTWPQMRKWLLELISAPAGTGVIAIDTIDWMIQRIIEYVVIDLEPPKAQNTNAMLNTLGSAHGGYYKAREIVGNIVYRELLPMLNAITNAGMAVILLAHAANTKMTTPTGVDLRLAGPDLPTLVAPPFIEWADAVLYAVHEAPRRYMMTEGTNIIVAKNRYSLPAELDLSWSAFVAAFRHNAKQEK